MSQGGYPFLERRAPTFVSPEINNIFIEMKAVKGQRRKAACHGYHCYHGIADPDPGSGAFLTPKSGTEKNSEP